VRAKGTNGFGEQLPALLCEPLKLQQICSGDQGIVSLLMNELIEPSRAESTGAFSSTLKWAEIVGSGVSRSENRLQERMGNVASNLSLEPLWRKKRAPNPFHPEILEHEPSELEHVTDEEENCMTSILYRDHISLESLEFDRYTALPIAKRGEVLIKVQAFGVNQIDIKLIEKNISTKILPLPKTFGSQFSGKVISTTACYTDYLTVGDHVVGMVPLVWTKKGTAAEFISVNENLCAKVPINVSVIDVAAIPLVGLAVLQSLREFLQNPKSPLGKRILIQDASSGIGAFATQYCKNVLGMYVIATCDERDLSFVQSLGADEIIDHEHAR
jgi:hypothetical protein